MSTQQNTEAARGARTVSAPEVAALQLAAAQLAEGAYVPEVRAGASLSGRGRGAETVAARSAVVPPVAPSPAPAPVRAAIPVRAATPVAPQGFFAGLMPWLLGRR